MKIIVLFLSIILFNSTASSNSFPEGMKKPLSKAGCLKLKDNVSASLKLMYAHQKMEKNITYNIKKADGFRKEAYQYATIYKTFCKEKS